jgi:hypothetical protein
MTHSNTPRLAAPRTPTLEIAGILAVLALWALVPEVRRLFDWRAGFAGVSLISIVPLAALVLPLAALLYGGRLARVERPLVVLAWIWFGGFTSALAIGAISGNGVAAALYTYAEFVLPAAFGLWVASLDVERAALFERVATFLLWLATPLALYAMLQLAYPPAWDVAWMRAAHIVSIGVPLPFQFRPFSTLNGPGTFADFLVAALLLNLPRLRKPNTLLVVQLTLCAGALALTMVRADWLALALGVAAYLILSPHRLRNLSVFVVVVGAFWALSAALPALLGSSEFDGGLGARLATLTNLQGDASFNERVQYYGEPLAAAAETPQGAGLGVLGTAAKLGARGSTKDFDNGYIARFTEMGWFGTACYLAATLGALGFTLARRGTFAPGIVAAVAAVQLALIALDVSSDHHSALSGVVFWLSLALLTRKPSPGAGSR